MIGSMKPWRGLAAGLIAVASLAVVVPSVTMAATRPDDRAGARPLPDAGTIVHSRPDDRAGVRGSMSSPPVLHSVTATSGAFNWRDAGAGAAVTFGAVSLIGIGVLATRRHGRAAHTVVTTSEGSAS
jgi:hypothetical protein